MKKYFILTTLLIISNLANAAPLRFDFTFAENLGTGRATGFIVFESTLLNNPGGGFYTLPNALIIDLQVTVTGTSSDDGVFTLMDFTDVGFNTGGIALDFSRDLVGQTTDFSPWGTSSQGGKSSQSKDQSLPEFRILSNQQAPAKLSNSDLQASRLPPVLPPSSTAPFILGTFGGVSMPIMSFAPAVINPIPSLNVYSIVLFGLLLLLAGFMGLRKKA